MMMSLGMFVFSMPTLAYQELARRSEWKLARNQRVGAKDAVQFTGANNETVSLGGAAYAELSDGVASLDKLRDMAKDGEAWPMVDGNGRVFGNYAIERIEERGRAHFKDGTPRAIDFSIELLEVDAPAAKDASK